MLITVLEERHEMGTKDASDLEKLFAALDSAVAKANVGSGGTHREEEEPMSEPAPEPEALREGRAPTEPRKQPTGGTATSTGAHLTLAPTQARDAAAAAPGRFEKEN